MSLVLDSSAALAWVYSKECTEPVRQVLEMVRSGGAWVPSLWRLEVANVLQMGIHRRRHNAAFRDATLADLVHLPIHCDSETDRHAWGATRQLAERHRLTLYDAAYLELAKRRNLPLATLDSDLRSASLREEVVLLGM